MPINKNVLVYGAIAIVVTIAVFIAILLIIPPNGAYEIKVSMLPLNYNPNATYPFNFTTFQILINNTGSTYVKGMQVGFYMDAQGIKYYNVSIPPHQHAYINQSYIYGANGTYNFSVIADPGHIMDISNSSVTQASLQIHVRPPQTPNLYEFLPYNGLNNTLSFSIFPKGMAFVSVAGLTYNQSTFLRFISQAPSIVSKMLFDLSNVASIANGVYSTYSNGSSAYGLWLEGELNNSDIKAIESTFSLHGNEMNISGNQVQYMKISNTTSMCSFSSGGWTKIAVYDNSSLHVTCANVVAQNYSSSEYQKLKSLADSYNAINTKLDNFSYINSTTIGLAVGVSRANYSTYRLFQNNAGSFATIFSSHPSINISKNFTCNGFVYLNNSTGFSTCSYAYVQNSAEFVNLSLVKSVAATPNYNLTVFSFVNRTTIPYAMLNAAELMYKLNLTSAYAKWTPKITSTCNFGSTPINCTFKSFNYSSGKASAVITNKLPGQIRILNVSCSDSNVQPSTKINATVVHNASVQLSFACASLSTPIQVSATETVYNMNMTYMYNNTVHKAVGFLTLANFYI
ncbi:hypothetical protein M1373_03370 [Candidatus Marsarchaeota archaeon]|nr:hypothetical protein [Candidatus Marsarchaeota archaeon]MCL5404785.1 hypothetical protein [Candidatus Marsarchaeota archaeon]